MHYLTIYMFPGSWPDAEVYKQSPLTEDHCYFLLPFRSYSPVSTSLMDAREINVKSQMYFCIYTDFSKIFISWPPWNAYEFSQSLMETEKNKLKLQVYASRHLQVYISNHNVNIYFCLCRESWVGTAGTKKINLRLKIKTSTRSFGK